MIELLSPAGNFDKMKAALLYGADAVYLAGPAFGMRAAADNFSMEELTAAVQYARKQKKKIYVTINTMPRTSEYKMLDAFLTAVGEAGPDAVIVADIGVFSFVRKKLPQMEIHISTQATVVSTEAAIAWYRLGAKRIVLARELTLEEIREIRRSVPKQLELEVFIHGAMCISYSGRCLLSEYFTSRDANRGMCTQPCRWEYTITEAKRPEMPLPIEETTDGTFVMSSRDLCMIEHIPELIASGVNSLKIEGRMKSIYYTAAVTNAYRMALDTYTASPDTYTFDPQWKREVESVSHREYSTGFYFDRCSTTAQVAAQTGYLREKAFVAVAVSYNEASGTALFQQFNKISTGDTVELLSPGRVGRPFAVGEITSESGEPLTSTPHPGMYYRLKTPFLVRPGDILRM